MAQQKILCSLATAICLAGSASAMEFQVLGTKAASMGGAGVASSTSSLATFNNPALLGLNKQKFTFDLGAGVGVKDTGAGSSIGKLSDLDFTNIIDAANGNAENLTSTEIDTLTKARDIVMGMDKSGFHLNPTADLALSFGSFGIGAAVLSDIGAVVNIDQSRDQLIFRATDGTYMNVLTQTSATLAEYEASSLAYAVENKSTNLDVVGLAVAEVPLAYGRAFDTTYGTLAVGGALKMMSGQTFYKQVNIDSGDSLDSITDNTLNSTSFGVDLGMAFRPSAVENLTVALVGKNLNTPAFDIAVAAGGGQYELKPAVRAGVAYKPREWIELAFDADLTENKSVTLYNTQYVGGGAHFDLKYIDVNLGLMQNIASNDKAGMIYTAGLSTGPSKLHFALAAQMASKSGEIDGQSYPQQAMVKFSLSSAW